MAGMSSKEKLDYSMRLMALVLGLAVKSVKEYRGKEGVSRLKQAFAKAGIDIGRAEQKRLGLGRNAKGLHRIEEEALKVFNIKYKVKKLTDEDYTLRVYNCPHGKNFKDTGAPAEVCDVFLGLDEGIVKSLNPKLEFALTKHILRGDKYCEYVVRPVKTSKG